MPYKDRHGRTCGFVDFEEQEQSGRFKRRYFMISPQDGAFYCYMDNPINLPDGSTPVTDIKLSHISNARDATKQRPKVEFCFVVTTPERSYYFGADNQADLEEWVRSLNGASRIMIPDKSAASADQASVQGQIDNSQNGGDKQTQSTTSYKTEIVGGVVIRTPVERDGHPAHNLPKKPMLCYPATYPASGALTLSATNPVDSDSDDDQGGRSRSWPRTPSPTPPLNRNLSTFPSHQAMKAGFCVKQGGVRKNWKRRFFILDENGISYFKSDTDKLPLRTIPKKDITSCRVSDIPLSTQRDNLFEVATGTRTFYVQAYSPEDMNDWVSRIKALVASKRSSLQEQSNSDTRGSLKKHDTMPEPSSNRESQKVKSERQQRITSRNSMGSSRPSLKDSALWYDTETVPSTDANVNKKGAKDQDQESGPDETFL